MNVVVEALPNCLAALRVEVASEVVSKTREQVVQKFLKEVRLPGFRPGKVPRAMVEKRFVKDIAEELESVLVNESIDGAVREKGLRILGVQSVDEAKVTDAREFSCSATLVMVPEFELPEYKGIAATVPSEEIQEKEVDEALEFLRERQADFEEVAEDRGAAMEDYVVVDYTGTSDGAPLTERFPKLSTILGHNAGFWIRMTEEAFFPGFCKNLVGMRVGETRTFPLEVPADFPVTDFAGQKVEYTVTLQHIKRRLLPELNDEFAGKVLEGKTLQDLRGMVQEDLKGRRQAEIRSAKEDAVLTALQEGVECELPEEMARSESQRVLQEIVMENQQRGVSPELLRENEKEIVSNASQTGRNRLKTSFILLRIAEKENLTVNQGDILTWVSRAAQQNNMTMDRVIRELRRRGTLSKVRSDLLAAKALEFVVSHVNASVAGAEV
jgi:trigger factor